MSEPGGGAVGVTDYELAALADLDPTPQARRALEAIGIDGLLDDPTAVRAGYASLLVRDVAGLAGSEIVAQGFAGALATMLSEADDILLMVATAADGGVLARSVLVDAPVGAFLLDMTSYGVHAAQPLADVSLLDLVHDVIANLAEDQALPLDVAVTRFPVDAPARPAAVRVVEPGLWSAAGEPAVSDAQAWASACSLLGRSDAESSAGARRAH